MKTITPQVKTNQIIVITHYMGGNPSGTITKVLVSNPQLRKQDDFTIRAGATETNKRVMVPDERQDGFGFKSSKFHKGIRIFYEDYYRIASEKEKRAYRKGIRNIDKM